MSLETSSVNSGPSPVISIGSQGDELGETSFTFRSKFSDKRERLYAVLRESASVIRRCRDILEETSRGSFQGSWRDACEEIRTELATKIYSESSPEIRDVIARVKEDITLSTELCPYFQSHPLIELFENINSTILKHEEYQEIIKKRSTPLEALGYCAVKTGLGYEAIERITTTTFNYEVYIDPEKITNSVNDCSGSFSAYFGIIVVLRDSESFERQVLAHERIHSLLGGAYSLSLNVFPREYCSQFNALIGGLNSKSFSNRALKKFRREFSPKELIDVVHEEILAEFGNVRSRLGRTEIVALEDGSVECRKVDHTTMMSTAGDFITDVCEHLLIQSDKLLKEEHRSEVVSTAQRVATLFNRQIDYLREALFVAEHCDSNLVKDIEALAVFLKPSQWRHLNSFLDYTLSTSVTKPMRTLFSILNGTTVDISNFMGIGTLGVHRLIPEDTDRLAELCRHQCSITQDPALQLFLATAVGICATHSKFVGLFY
jgi:hypothetical protein